MTLKDLVEKYDGEITFAVSRLVSGGVEDVVDFSSNDSKAIKDEIMNSTVSSFAVDITSATRATSIKVVLDELIEEPVETTETESAEVTA